MNFFLFSRIYNNFFCINISIKKMCYYCLWLEHHTKLCWQDLTQLIFPFFGSNENTEWIIKRYQQMRVYHHFQTKFHFHKSPNHTVKSRLNILCENLIGCDHSLTIWLWGHIYIFFLHFKAHNHSHSDNKKTPSRKKSF